MSYVRFGPDSSVYMFRSCSGGIERCHCGLTTPRRSVVLTTFDGAIAHLREHEAAGDGDYSDVIAEIEEDKAAGVSLETE